MNDDPSVAPHGLLVLDVRSSPVPPVLTTEMKKTDQHKSVTLK